jgi:NADPH-dependent 2,4-dienoyl-CoA reductase/sulfur reductase-like enzyme
MLQVLAKCRLRAGLLRRLYRGRHISCVGNPVTGRERDYRVIETTGAPKRVFVIGGGPADIEAACVAALRGHKVTLSEASGFLGGRLDLARRPNGRDEWTRLIRHKSEAIERAGVEIRLNAPVDAATLEAEKPDLVVLATGGRFERPTLPGSEDAPLYSVDEAVADPDKIGQHVLVIDQLDRQPGMVTAIMLAEMGRDVEIASPAFHIGQKLEIQNITYFYRRALQAGVRFTAISEAHGFDGGRVTFVNPFTRERRVSEPYDSIVLAIPGKPRDDLAEDVARLGIPCKIIGDAYALRDVEAAILEGFEAGFNIH